MNALATLKEIVRRVPAPAPAPMPAPKPEPAHVGPWHLYDAPPITDAEIEDTLAHPETFDTWMDANRTRTATTTQMQRLKHALRSCIALNRPPTRSATTSLAPVVAVAACPSRGVKVYHAYVVVYARDVDQATLALDATLVGTTGDYNVSAPMILGMAGRDFTSRDPLYAVGDADGMFVPRGDVDLLKKRASVFYSSRKLDDRRLIDELVSRIPLRAPTMDLWVAAAPSVPQSLVERWFLGEVAPEKIEREARRLMAEANRLRSGRDVKVAVWTPQEREDRAAGYVVAPKSTRTVRVPWPLQAIERISPDDICDPALRHRIERMGGDPYEAYRIGALEVLYYRDDPSAQVSTGTSEPRMLPVGERATPERILAAVQAESAAQARLR